MTKREEDNADGQNLERRSHFNPNRASYLSADGRYYCYDAWDPEICRVVTHKCEVGKDLSEELTVFLDGSDHDMDLNDRYEEENRDVLFDRKASIYESSEGEDGAEDPWNEIEDKSSSLYREEVPENPDSDKVRQVIDRDCTPAQQDLFFEHFGSGRQLTDIASEEEQKTGKPVSRQAMNSRKNKLIRKVAKKAFGVEPIKRNKKTR
ncbi:MAG: hypothetical protein LKE44_09995 [Eubacterium sp.]|jgi:hypothetical protein|nr:hypothetical protein [Eubacterium sp.]